MIRWRSGFVLSMMLLLSPITCADDDEYKQEGDDNDLTEPFRPNAGGDTEQAPRKKYNSRIIDDELEMLHKPVRDGDDINPLPRNLMRTREESVERFKPIDAATDDEGEPMPENEKVSPVNHSEYRAVIRKEPAALAAKLPQRIEATPRNKDLPELECYECAYTIETPQRSCLDPVQHRVHTVICNSVELCYVSIVYSSRKMVPMRVSRGCRSRCVGTMDTTCCESNLCNGDSVKLPFITKAVLTSKSDKTIPPTVLFFVTILLLLQTVVKVSIA